MEKLAIVIDSHISSIRDLARNMIEKSYNEIHLEISEENRIFREESLKEIAVLKDSFEAVTAELTKLKIRVIKSERVVAGASLLFGTYCKLSERCTTQRLVIINWKNTSVTLSQSRLKANRLAKSFSASVQLEVFSAWRLWCVSSKIDRKVSLAMKDAFTRRDEEKCFLDDQLNALVEQVDSLKRSLLFERDEKKKIEDCMRSVSALSSSAICPPTVQVDRFVTGIQSDRPHSPFPRVTYSFHPEQDGTLSTSFSENRRKFKKYTPSSTK
jgi:hypothetical protein